MGLTLKSIAQFQTDLQNGFTAAQKIINDFSVGSVALAMVETLARQFGFVQSQASQILLVTRAATSSGADLWSFTADYYLTPAAPLPATYNQGTVIFSANQPTIGTNVLLDGTIVQNQTPTPATAIQYETVADPTDSTWSANAGGPGVPGRTVAPGTLQQPALVQALVAGTSSAMTAGSLSVIASPGVPFNTVSNTNDINNASNQETDAQVRQRFSDYMSSRSGTYFQIAAAVAGVQAGLSFTLNDLTYKDGTPRDGNGTIVVDDGSGQIPNATLTAVETAVQGPTVKSFGADIWVVRPTNVPITIAVSGVTVNTAAGFGANDVQSAIQAALVAFVNANGVGGAPAGTGSNPPTNKLSYVAIANLVASFIGTGPGQGLASYAEVLVNGAQADVPLTNFQLARTSTASVTVT